MSYPKVMKRSSQGHNKVKLDQNRWNSLFVLCSLRFYLLQTSMVIKTSLYPNIEIIPNTDYRGFIGVGGVSPLSDHPYASPSWYGTNLQNNRQIVVLRFFARYSMEIMKHNPSRSTYGDMLWGWASYGCYSEVMTRSSEGHIKVKTAPNGWNIFLLSITFIWDYLRWLKTT